MSRPLDPPENQFVGCSGDIGTETPQSINSAAFRSCLLENVAVGVLADDIRREKSGSSGTEFTAQSPALRSLARKIVLPSFVLTEVCSATDNGSVLIRIPGAEGAPFYARPKMTDSGERVDSKPVWKKSQFNLYPVVLDSNALPWPEANIYILAKLEDALSLSMSTVDGIADDLAVFRRFLDDGRIDWRNFPRQKLSRPTYRYHSHLKRLVENNRLAASTARRRMSSTIGFYRWMESSGLLVLEHRPAVRTR